MLSEDWQGSLNNPKGLDKVAIMGLVGNLRTWDIGNLFIPIIGNSRALTWTLI